MDNVSFQGAGVIVNLQFPEEANPTDTITLNLTITAQVGLNLQNFTFIIRVFVGTGWQQIYDEQVLSLSMPQSNVLSRLIWFTLPQNANDSLKCYMYVLTDHASGLPSIYNFNATTVRTMTYDQLLANYSSLLTNYDTLLGSYNALSTRYAGLNSTYTSLLNKYNSLQATFESLNASYSTQKTTYNALKANYDSLNASYRMLNQSYCTLKGENNSLSSTAGAQDTELTMTKDIMYALAVVTVTLAALVAYNKKKKSEPYVILRKETVALKPT
ncbi:MAG TPA: hypothetical protein VK487_11975 [Candidatus Bathyarchaeia archaeon]|nr:hypothetical protein [Candidatus Bathyarchaeia archaeon]